MSYPAPWRGIDSSIDGIPSKIIKAKKNKQFQAHILVVDDEPRARDSLKELLRLSGYGAVAANDGREAIEKMKERRYDLVMLDLNMPGVSGKRVMEFINEQNIGSDVIIISGSIAYDHAIHSLRRGAYDFIRKPYMPDELLRSVSNALEKRRLQEENKSIQLRLEESESLHKFIVNNSPDMIYLLDEEGRFAFVNARIESLLGFNQDEIVGEHFSSLIYDVDSEKANHIFNERRTGDRATKSTELRLRCKDCDSPHYFESRSVPIELSSIGIYTLNASQKKEFIGTYGVARDITERKQKS